MNIAQEEDRGEQDENDDTEKCAEQGKNADMYQHIKEVKKTFDTQALDAATKVNCNASPIMFVLLLKEKLQPR